MKIPVRAAAVASEDAVEDGLLGDELLAEGEEAPCEISIFRESRENRLEVVSQHPGFGRLVSQQ